MNILCTGGALPREESLRKEDKSEKKTGVRKCNLFSSVTVAINKKKRKKEMILLCRKIADHGIDRHNIAIITLKSIRRS